MGRTAVWTLLSGLRTTGLHLPAPSATFRTRTERLPALASGLGLRGVPDSSAQVVFDWWTVRPRRVRLRLGRGLDRSWGRRQIQTRPRIKRGTPGVSHREKAAGDCTHSKTLSRELGLGKSRQRPGVRPVLWRCLEGLMSLQLPLFELPPYRLWFPGKAEVGNESQFFSRRPTFRWKRNKKYPGLIYRDLA
jgi:hypothetical protein